MRNPIKKCHQAAPSFLEPRFKKDQKVTDEVIKSRGQSFELSSEKLISRLTRPSLVSSTHGAVDQILLTLPSWLFLNREEVETTIFNDDFTSYEVTANAFKSILKHLPKETKFLILIHDKAVFDDQEYFNPRDRLTEWLEPLGRTEFTKIITAPSTVNFTMWAEDAYVISEDLDDTEAYFVKPTSYNRGDDLLIADTIAESTSFEHTQANLYFQGGNLLIGDDFWFIGMDYPKRSLEYGHVKPAPYETPYKAVTQAYRDALDNQRKVIQIGSRLPVPSFDYNKKYKMNVKIKKNDDIVKGETWTELLYCANEPWTVQPMFHIDMFLTLAGRDEDGKYIVLVGDPRLAAEILEEFLEPHAMADIFDDIACQLETLGFRVVRNPLPLTYYDNLDEKVRTWYFASSNNALVQVMDESKAVWLPTYGHRYWPELEATDKENIRIWKDELKFIVHDLGDFHPFAVNSGAAHCVTKYLSRR